ncbi:hypothetical protein C343_06203 [Cryptococcus neoformans C23]|uniref:Zn(2)-C6 fungal-type domain-containing protein n=1 Tax=Cryptococcus neoformans (strain H99 / ATCC 208821 / CBS 10515 / FGSC 9487) TaxID=235443 RepID=J9VVD5_CRYN9|nr:hypothetical protein CNAG_05990 [Cryptococcus neoformans var. grubii H99]AUB28340.1 hypothetical protein CKF44_05990 [Cryptococcus neoformans var. grubii]OWZ27363.1 hypothetical protein C347_06203 [Cryptococcus neoformans var. grubii AD2-60a]OWZ39424.1 hypothetical protein C343_06203 [Cryptococcus neoformans var. grubii C23]OWZ78041.1 hypothetical protein C365_03800 [Cryptococcus neoformans var. grubii Bt85]OXC81623.1 hypothetical protein C344_06106 [Cryptococcus neoformans var. grubii AD1-|eukprot:XP_012052954.1 hypothetical protein CNAG_05990 [Cryptococcus neoformans var. grubii H99]
MAPAIATAPIRRSSKACESCRIRRVRCSGVVPCEPCRERGMGNSCEVRQKARPRRALPAPERSIRRSSTSARLASSSPQRTRGGPALSESGLSSERSTLETGHQLEPSSSHRRSPLDQIEGAVERWCQGKNISISSLRFQIEIRLEPLHGLPLPPTPLIHTFEDSLIDHLFNFSSHDCIQAADRPRFLDRSQLLSLYSRFRAVPNSLTDDQKALVYATLCLSRFNQIKKDWEQEVGEGATPGMRREVAREDVTYFWKACTALRDWNRPSIFAMWTLFCLVPYTIGSGTPSEMRALLEQTARHSTQLGLHKEATASLYAPHEQVGLLFSAFYYSDIFRASLTDLKPCIPLSEIDVDPTPPPQLIPHCLARASYHTAKYLKDYADPDVDTTTEEYITSTESRWMGDLKALRHGKDECTPRSLVAWAEFRYSWLRILLYAPHLTHARLAAQAHSAIARAITQILHIYPELVAIRQLNPSWPQIQRLVVCGQLLILCYESGELRRCESQTLFGMVVDLLDKHALTWPICAGLAEGFQRAARAFDLQVERQLVSRMGESSGGGASVNEDMGAFDGTGPWGGFSLDYFDPTLLFALSYDTA